MIVRAALFEQFVDRSAELDALRTAFLNAGREERSATVAMIGEAGIGKTRLLAEFRRRIALKRGHYLAGACLEYARTPYGPFLDALAQEPRSAHALEALRTHAPSDRDREEETMRRFGLVEQFFRRVIALRGTTVLVLEDVHWSDLASLDLLRYLGHRLRDVPALLVATLRSEELERNPRLASSYSRLLREGTAELRVGPIADDALANAIRSAAPAGFRLGGSVVRRLCELSEGKPLVAEELLRGAIDGGPSGDIDTNRVLSIRSSVLERVHALDAQAQETLIKAAVIGREFGSALVATIGGRSEAEVLRALRAARAAQLIAQAGGDRFTFRHAVTREILYGELLAAEARALHALIAGILERNGGDAAVDEIAYHWWAARDARRAVTWNERAGNLAAGMHAYADAALRYERALEFAAHGTEQRRTLLERATFALVTTGEMDDARALCREAAEAHRELGDEDGALRLMLWVARQWYESGALDRAFETVQAVRAQVAGRPPTPVAFTAETTYAAMVSLGGKPEEALALLREAATWPCEHDAIDDFRALNTEGIALCDLGRYGAASAAHARAASLAEQLANVDLTLHSLNNAANVRTLIGDLEGALKLLRAGLALAERNGFSRMKALFVTSIASCALAAGELETARQLLHDNADLRFSDSTTAIYGRAISIRFATLARDEAADASHADFIASMLQHGEPQVIAAGAGAIAKDLIAADDLEPARALIVRTLGAVTSFDCAGWYIDAAAELGDERAVAHARRLLASARESPLAQAYALLVEARSAARSGLTTQSRDLALRAHDAFAALRFPVESADALELAADPAGALAILRHIGACGAARRLERRSGRRGVRAAKPSLTRREREIALLLARGYSGRVVAAELGIGERTVETHVAAIYQKLGIKSRAELALRMKGGSG